MFDPPVPVGRAHRSRRRAWLVLVAGGGGVAATAFVVGLAVSGGNARVFYAVALGLLTLGWFGVLRSAAQFVRFDADGSYLRVHNTSGRRRLPVGLIEGFAWPVGERAWATPVVLVREGQPVPLGALRRFDLGVLSNEREVDAHLSWLHAELMELERRRTDP